MTNRKKEVSSSANKRTHSKQKPSHLRRNDNKKKTFSPIKSFIGIGIILLLGIIGVAVPKQIYVDLGLLEEPAKKENLKPDETLPTSTKKGIEDFGKSHFTKEELTDQKKGYIVYEEKDELGRPTGAYGLFKKDMINTGTPANQKIKPPGFKSGNPPYEHSRGHLIGRQLGGSGDDERNLITLYQRPANTPYMTTYENQIRRVLEKGQTVFYRVKVDYEENRVFPVAVTMEAKSLESSDIDFYVRIFNRKE